MQEKIFSHINTNQDQESPCKNNDLRKNGHYTVSPHIDSLDMEKQMLSGFIDSICLLSSRLKREEDGAKRNSKQIIQNEYITLVANQENYLSLANPEVTIISEQYSQFNTIKSHYDDVIQTLTENNIRPDKKNDPIRKELDKYDSYFKQFAGLYDRHIRNWQMLIDMDALDRKFEFDEMLTTGLKMDQKGTVIPVCVVFDYMDKIQKEELTVEDLKDDAIYNKIKEHIHFFSENQHQLLSKVSDMLALGHQEINEYTKKISNMLKSLHKYCTDSINSLYDKKYAHIPIEENIHSGLSALEDAIKSLRQYYNI